MHKRYKIIYWIATLWLCLGMTATGIVQLGHMPEEVEKIGLLGYPAHLLTLLGVWKLLGVIALLLPRLPLLKEWAYAGFFFAMSGAVYTHIVMGDRPAELFGPLLLILLTILSRQFRPADRKLTTA